MKRTILGTILLHGAAVLAFSQPPEAAPKFEAADVHVSAKTTNPFVRTGPVHAGRYDIRTATMVDLIHLGYGFDNDKILGGPNWLEMDRFDVVAKVPPESTPETQKQMLQAMLEDRFHLVTHKDSKPLPTYALQVGKKPLIKKADGTGETGCKPQTGSNAPAGGVMMVSMMNGVETRITLGPGMTVQFNCRNVTMATFAAGLRGMMGAAASLGLNPVLDETGLEGAWDFDVSWSMGLQGPMIQNADRVTVVEAVEKQLGLKLQEEQVPTPVLMVDQVNQTPTPNPPEVAELLPSVPAPTEFEVAVIKPSDPAGRGGRFQMQPGGRLLAEGMNMRFLIGRAFNTTNNDQVVGLPKWADTDRFDITAKAPSGGPQLTGMDMDLLAPMMKALLVDRFKMTYHTEDRPATAYSLVAAKPKMKKADPASRTWCKNMPAPAGSPPGTQILNCQNATMAQLAERLRYMSPELSWPILDATGIEGGWDLTLTFTRNFGMAMPVAAASRSGDGPPQPGGNMASDPSGGQTLFEAIEKQLGLKLEMQKRPMPVIVIDHIEQKPTDN